MMGGLPVTLVNSGGMPVTESDNDFGLPVEYVASGGLPVTLTTSPGAIPLKGGTDWAPSGAVAGYNAQTGQTWQTTKAFTRASTALWNGNGANDWASYAVDTLRQVNGVGMILEAAETYYPVNSVLSGAVIGAIGSGGAVPTGWNISDGGGTVTVDAIGTLNGFPAITLTLDVENSGGSTIAAAFRFGTGTPAVQGDDMTFGMIYKSVANPGDTADIAKLQIREYQVDTQVSYGEVVLAGDGSRQGMTHTVADATADNVIGFIRIAVDPGKALRRTMTIAIPTLTKSGVLSSPMPTTDSGNVTRAADTLTLTPVSGASLDWHARYDDDSEEVIAAGVTGDYQVDPANDLSRPVVKLVWATAA